MPTVQSKYKNPDKYIQNLKSRIKYVENVCDSLRESFHKKRIELQKFEEETFGKHWFNYSNDGADLDVNFKSSAKDLLPKLKIGDQITCTGEIVEMVISKNGKNTADFKIKKVYIKQ